MKQLFGLTKKQWIFILALVGFFVMCFLFVLLGLSRKTIPTPTPSQNQQPIPTPVILTPISIKAVLPTQNQKSLLLATSLFVAFSQALTTDQQSHVALSLNPSTPGTMTWTSDRTVSFTPFQLLQPTTTYTATVLYENKSYSWQFQTQVIDTTSIQAKLQQQTLLDTLWGQHQQQVYTNFPWFGSLPISGNKYFTTFDTKTQTFTSSLYTTSSSPLTSQQQIDHMKQEIQQKLTNIGVDVTKYTFSYTVTPVSE